MRRSARSRLPVLALFWMLSAAGFASGPRFVTGPPFFTGRAGAPIAWKQSQLTYFTDPGSLSASVNHAAADTLVATAAAVWNIPQASVTLSRGGALAEHVSGQNVYLDTSGMVYPADVMNSNASAVPIAIVYDTDGSVTDTLLGAGASLPSGCRSNAVTESVDSFDPAGYILHAVIVLNGRCTGPAAAQQSDMEYKLVRAFGRVLGLGWSQANDNVFTGVPTPTYVQAMHWPLMHPLDIICGPYSFQCLPSPFTLRPDDIASMVLLYPNADGAVLAAGKQVSLAAANSVIGVMTFPTGAGMGGVNVLMRRQPGFSTATDPWVETATVTGYGFRGAGSSPFLAVDQSAPGSMGTTWPGQPGLYNLPYIPMLDGAAWDDLLTATEPVNPLYLGAHSVGPYSLGAVTPSGSPPVLPSLLVVSSDTRGYLAIPVADAAPLCGDGADGTAGTPADAAATGWWHGLLCGIGHAAYVNLNVRASRSLTIEATALDEQGLSTIGKAMPVIALFAPSDQAWDLPSLGYTPSAFQALTTGTTTLSAATVQGGSLRIGIADERGDGRPDFAFQGRIFYADNLEPARVPSAGATITITGMGFRAGNSVLVHGVAATVKSWTANTIVAVVPTMAAAGAADKTAVDVQVIDRGTGASSTLSAALTYDLTPALPNAMILVSAPEGTVLVGNQAPAALSVRVVAGDGVTPVAGDTVTFSASSGSAAFAACAGAATCNIVTDSTGLASTGVTPQSAGAIVLNAQDGALLQTATFAGEADASAMLVLGAPTGSWPAGSLVYVPFVVRVTGPNGNGLPGRLIRFSVVGGSGRFPTCFASVCSMTTDATGAAAIYVTPSAGGPITLEAADGAVTQQISFTATDTGDTMQIVSTPTATVKVGDPAGMFSVRLVGANGGGDYGQPVNFSGPPGVYFGACASAACPLLTDSNGSVGTVVLAQQAGTFTIQASYGSLVRSATFSTTTPTRSLRILSAPSGNVPLGSSAAVPFSAEVIGYDGRPMTNIFITLAGPADQVWIESCHEPSCEVATDANGVASTVITPRRAGTLTLGATYVPMTATTSFTVVEATDTLRVVAQPGTAPVYVGDPQIFTVQLLQPTGISDAGKTVTFTVTNGSFSLAACGAGACTVTTDANGMASMTGSASAAGSVTVSAAFGSVRQAMTFVATVRVDVLRLVSAPAGTVFTGVPAASAFSLRVFAPDGVTPAPNRSVTLSASSGNVLLGACGAGVCVLTSDASGLVSTAVTPVTAGSITLLASDGAASATATFTALDRPDVLRLVSAPAGTVFTGVAAAAPFSLRVYAADGATPEPNRSVTLSASSGNVLLGACGGSVCVLTSDASGLVSTAVTPVAAGSITLLASDGAASLTATFTAADRPDVVSLLSAPASGAYTGVAAALPFAIQVLHGDGSPASVKNVTFSVTNGSAAFAGCGGSAACVLATDFQGRVSSSVTPGAAGTIGLSASEGGLAATAGFTAVDRADVLQIVSVPANGALVGDAAAASFSVKVLSGDGVTALAGRSVVVSVVGGAARLGACGAALCTLTTDAGGLVASSVTPLAPGTITLQVADGTVVASASFTAAAKPDRLVLLSAPASGGFVGAAAAPAFSIQVLLGDAVTPGVGHTVTVSVTNGSATLAGCNGASSCILQADASGQVSSTVTPSAPGTFALLATDGSASVSASFTAQARPDLLQVVSAPGDGALVGDAAAANFAVQALAADGVTPLAGRAIVLSVAGGAARLGACGAASCTVLADANGVAATTVTPLAAGTILLRAADGSVTTSATFAAANKPDLLTIVSAPSDGAWVGEAAGASFTIHLVAADGVTPAAGQAIAIDAGGLASFGACAASACSIVTDADGLAGSTVTPLVAGTVLLTAALGSSVQSATFVAVNRPDLLRLVSAPADGALVGDTAGAAFTVQVLQSDGVTPAVNKSVTMTVTNGSAQLLACAGAASCVLRSDASGLVTSGVVPGSAGAVGLQAAEGTATVSASFRADSKPDVLRLVASPQAAVYVGDAATVGVMVFQSDGITPAVGRTIAFALSGGAATFAGCPGTPCVVVTDVSGYAGVAVQPSAAGPITVAATEAAGGAAGVSASFNAIVKRSALLLVGGPGASVYVGSTAAAALAVKVLGPDGVTPAAGVGITFSAGPGASGGAVRFEVCGAATCRVVTGADGAASTLVTGVNAGAVSLLVHADAAVDVPGLTVPFAVEANQDTLTAAQGTTYVAAGVAFARVLQVAAVQNGAAAAGQALAWSATGGAAVQSAAAFTDTQGSGVARAVFGPLAAAGQGQVAACAWGSTCATFASVGVGSAEFALVVVNGGAQIVSGGAALAPVQVRVVDAAGHGVAGAVVQVEQTVTALTLACPATGRCPAQPVLLSGITAGTSDAEGLATAVPLAIAGTATETRLAFSAGDQGFQAVVLTSHP